MLCENSTSVLKNRRYSPTSVLLAGISIHPCVQIFMQTWVKAEDGRMAEQQERTWSLWQLTDLGMLTSSRPKGGRDKINFSLA